MSSPNPQKGSLEELFRHHLTNEAAAVPPRAHVWEQLDNRLLLAENARYRRRLQTHRWALAASLLLASLAGGGWWQSQRGPASAPLASAGSLNQRSETRPPDDQPGVATARRAAGWPRLAPQPAVTAPTSPIAISTSSPAILGKTATSLEASAAASSRRLAPAADANARQRASSGSLALTDHAASVARAGGARDLFTSPPPPARFAPGAVAGMPAETAAALAALKPAVALAYDDPATGPALAPPRGASSADPSALGQRLASARADAADAAGSAPAVAAIGQAGSMPGSSVEQLFLEETTTLVSSRPAGQAAASVPAAVAALTGRASSLALADAAGLPLSLAAPARPELPPPAVARAWQFGVSYASGLFSPNVDFAKDSSRYNPSFGAKSSGLTRNAAAEYRAQLRPGLSQRLSLWASRRLGNGRWGLRGGLELSQQTASSATSSSFVGEQVADFGSTLVSSRSAALRGTTFRYRAASVSAEARYGNPAKTGFSLYGRMGALLSALFSARGEVDGNPEAARSYSLMSPSMPYRRLSASVRGGGGLQFRPANHAWALSLGPVAEVGVLSLNADPQQGFWQQQRPYSFGLEAGFELGRAPKRTLGL